MCSGGLENGPSVKCLSRALARRTSSIRGSDFFATDDFYPVTRRPIVSRA
jgi:hypothetical protein